MCLTLCNPMDCSPPGTSLHGILRARVLKWAAISFSRGSSRPRDPTCVSSIVGRCFYCLSHQGSPILNKNEHTQNRASTPVTGRWAGQIIAAWVRWQGPTLKKASANSSVFRGYCRICNAQSNWNHFFTELTCSL